MNKGYFLKDRFEDIIDILKDRKLFHRIKDYIE